MSDITRHRSSSFGRRAERRGSEDVAVKELLPELTTSLQLPITGPDGRPMSYRMDSKALGRELQEEETLSRPPRFRKATA